MLVKVNRIQNQSLCHSFTSSRCRNDMVYSLGAILNSEAGEECLETCERLEYLPLISTIVADLLVTKCFG